MPFTPDGSQAGFTSTGATAGNNAFIAQDLATIVPGSTYTLSVMVGQSLNPLRPLLGYELQLGYDTTPHDPTTFVSFATVTFGSPGDIPAPGEFQLATITAIAPFIASGDLAIIMGSGSFAFWDEVSVTETAAAAVPGPVVGAGLPGLVMAAGAFLAWRRRKQAA